MRSGIQNLPAIDAAPAHYLKPAHRIVLARYGGMETSKGLWKRVAGVQTGRNEVRYRSADVNIELWRRAAVVKTEVWMHWSSGGLRRGDTP